MNYEKLYYRIIENSKQNELDRNVYGETHHIVPRCLGGNNTADNLVRLTAREHFLCHYCLVKMYEDKKNEYYKMLHAFMIMKAGTKSGTQQGRRYFNSRLYESLRIEYSKHQSKSQSGKKNSQYNSIWIKNFELKECKKIKKSELEKYLAEGWVKGRVINFDKIVEKCKVEKIEGDRKKIVFSEEYKLKISKQREEKKIYFEQLYEVYKQYDFDIFKEITGWDKTQSTLVCHFTNYLNYKEISKQGSKYKYSQKVNYCNFCNKELDYSKRKNKYCSIRCYNDNKKRHSEIGYHINL